MVNYVVDPTAAEEVAHQIEAGGRRAITIKADVIFLAMGFLGPRKTGFVEKSGVALDARSNVQANMTDYQTSEGGIFACGDMRRGQSLVVWAIREGRQCARAVDLFLMGESELPR